MLQAANAAGMRLIPQEDQQQQTIITLRSPGSAGHTSGRCRMGVSSEYASTNKFGEVFGVSGLLLADSSVLPSLPAANPTLTT